MASGDEFLYQKEQDVEILLVEDNPNDAELAIRAFRKGNVGGKLIRVSDGEEALDFLFARNAFHYRQFSNLPKLILLDLKLPKIDGLEVLKVIKKDITTRSVPVVILTSSREEHDLVESYKLGVNSYVVKPVDFDLFIESLTAIGIYWLKINQQPDSKNLIK